MKLNDQQIDSKLVGMRGWTRKDEKWIVKKYRFKQFTDSIQFVNGVAEISEKFNHHPMISIDFKMVTLSLTSWSAAGNTDLDFTLAAEFDRLYDAK